MSGTRIPSEAPPSYNDAVGPSSSSRPHATANATTSDHLDIPGHAKSGISAERRRSMEDESRPVPEGWVRTFDPESGHHFYVDITTDPPRSIWTHPYDDDKYLSTLSSSERERIEQETFHRGRSTSKADIMAAHSDDDGDDDTHQATSSTSSHQHATGTYPDELPTRDNGKKKGGFGRKFKDKITGTTHEERERTRAQRAEEERRIYAQHQRIREAMARAAQTGEPQLVGKDRDGKDLYVEPPSAAGGYGGPPGYGGYGAGGYGGGYGNYGGGYGLGYASSGRYGGGTQVYSTPNARFVRPAAPYSRPIGYGYGGGYGLPLAMGMGGGLLGGMLMADMMF